MLLIDDTPADVGWLPIEWRRTAEEFESRHGLVPGKGMLVARYLEGRAEVAKIHHHYQVLYRF